MRCTRVVGPHLTNGVFLHETIATMQLQAFIQYPCLRVCRPVFAHCRFVWCEFAAQMFCHAFIKECAADIVLVLHSANLNRVFWNCIIGRQGFAFAAICDVRSTAALHCAMAEQAMINVPGQLVHQLIEPFSLFPAQILFGCDLDVVKEQF